VEIEEQASFKVLKRAKFVTQSVCYDDRGNIQSNTFALLDEINDVFVPEVPPGLLDSFLYCRKGYADFYSNVFAEQNVIPELSIKY